MEKEIEQELTKRTSKISKDPQTALEFAKRVAGSPIPRPLKPGEFMGNEQSRQELQNRIAKIQAEKLIPTDLDPGTSPDEEKQI